MARASTGGIVEKKTSQGTSYAARFRTRGKRHYVLIGYACEGWTRRKAEEELANIMADVRRGTWTPPDRSPVPEPVEVPSFHVFASEWLASREADGLRPKTIGYLKWALTDHLLATFADVRVDRITVEMVDRYKRAKAAEGKLSNASVNKTLDVLSSVLEIATEYGHLDRNPAKGKRRRLPVPDTGRSFLDRAEHVAALLDGASEVDRRALSRKGQRRALLAVLSFAGLRIGEALDLEWRDVNLADGKLRVRAGKTAAAARVVDIRPALRDELASYRATASDAPGSARVFATTTGGRQSETNVRRRILAPAVKVANERLEADGLESLPDRLTPHSLRRTFASILAAIGTPMPVTIREMGHRDPAMTLRAYAFDAGRGEAERERLRALIDGRDWAPMGTSAPTEGLVAAA